jgi:5-methylcytosine-specific restriction endonuclease McrA
MPPKSHLNALFKSAPVKVNDKYRKRKIPAAIREAVWVKHCGRVFEHKCFTSWCQNTITAFDFQCGHNIPESKGGTLAMSNLYPLCARCNVSMGDRYSIDEWNAIEPATVTVQPTRTWRQFLQLCFH